VPEPCVCNATAKRKSWSIVRNQYARMCPSLVYTKLCHKIFLLEECTLSAYCAGMAACGLSQAIQSLPPELRERILKEFIAVKTNEKNRMGWGMVHDSLLNLPFCKHFKKIVNKVASSSKLTGCIFECSLCLVELEIRKRMFEITEPIRRSKEEKNVLKFLGPKLQKNGRPRLQRRKKRSR